MTDQTLERRVQRENEQPSSSLEMYDRAVRSNAADEYLANLNLGLGNYSNSEMWQQVESYADGRYAEAAFSRRLIERAIDETKTELALEAWRDLDAEEREVKDRRRFVERKKDELWQEYPGKADKQTDQLDLVEQHAGITSAWVPPQHQLMEMRHEASRSRGARLLDNLFDRVREVFSDSEEVPQDAMGGGRR